MTDFELDNELRKTLHECVEHLQADDLMKERIDFMIQQPKRKNTWKRICVGIIAAACLATVGAVARGQIAGLISSTYLTKQIYSISELNDDADKISGKISLHDKLNGYDFTSGNIQNVNKVDNSMNKIGEYSELYAQYGDLTVTVHKYDAEIDEVEYPLQQGQNPQSKDINGVSVSYRTDKYLFVPADYKLTDEEKQMQENNEIVISYGSDSREEQVFTSVSWEQDGLVYSVFTFSDVTSENMFDAAKQIIS